MESFYNFWRKIIKNKRSNVMVIRLAILLDDLQEVKK